MAARLLLYIAGKQSGAGRRFGGAKQNSCGHGRQSHAVPRRADQKNREIFEQIDAELDFLQGMQQTYKAKYRRDMEGEPEKSISTSVLRDLGDPRSSASAPRLTTGSTTTQPADPPMMTARDSNLSEGLEAELALSQHQLLQLPAPKFILHPQSRAKVAWDAFVGVLIIYTVMLLPWRIGFDQEAQGGALFLDYLVDVFFGMDVVLCFATGYFIDDKYISDPFAIAKRYMCTFFIADFLSCFPFMEVVQLASEGSGASQMRSIKLMKFVRLVRLTKLIRLLKLKKFFMLLEEVLEINPNILTLIKVVLQIVFMAHLLACLWHLVAVQNEQNMNWITSFGINRLGQVSRYVASFHFVVATMMAVGYGEIRATNTLERIVAVLIMLVGATSLGFILSTVTALMASANPREREEKQRLAEVNEWLIGRDIPRALRRAVRAHFSYALTRRSVFNEAEILGNMSTHLRVQIACHSYKRTIASLSRRFMVEDLSFLIELVLQFKPQLAPPGEIILEAGEVATDLYFLISGRVEGFQMVLDSEEPSPLPDRALWPSMCLRLNVGHSEREQDLYADVDEPSEEDDALVEVLCAIYHTNEVFGQFPGSPMMIAGSAVRSELLGINKDWLIYLLSRHPRPLRHYRNVIDKHALEQLEAVFASPMAVDLPQGIDRPVKSIILIKDEARPLDELKMKPRDLKELFQLPPHLIAAASSTLKEVFRSDGSSPSCSDHRSSGRASTDSTKLWEKQAAFGSEMSPTLGTFTGSPSSFAGSSSFASRGGATLQTLRLQTRNTSDPEIENERGVIEQILTASMRTYSHRGSDRDSSGSGSSTSSVVEAEETEADLLARGIIPPMNTQKFKWDAWVGVLIVYSVVIIPYRICFGVESSQEWVLFDMMVDIFFLIDMILNFRTAFVNTDGLMNTVPRSIQQNYLRTWFAVDFLSTFPVDYVVLLVVGDNAGASARSFKLVRIVRLVRLLKLARFLKMGRLIRLLEDRIEVSPMVMQCANLGSKLVVLSHFVGCFWYFFSLQTGEGETECSSGRLLCESDAPATTWWESVNIKADQQPDKYIASFYWAVTTMTTVGYGDIFPQSDMERVYAIVAMIFGATIFGTTIGTIAAIGNQERGVEALTKKRLALVREFCEDACVSKRSRDMVLSHYKFHYEERSPYEESDILVELPSPLRKQLVLYIFRESITKIGLFTGASQMGFPGGPLPAWFVAVAMQMLDPMVAFPGEDVLRLEDRECCHDIYFLQQGDLEGYVARESRASEQVKEQIFLAQVNELNNYEDDEVETTPKGILSPKAMQARFSVLFGKVPTLKEKLPPGLGLDEDPEQLRKHAWRTTRTVCTFPPGSMIGLEHLVQSEKSGWPPGYHVRCSFRKQAELFVLRQSVMAEVTTSTPELAKPLRDAYMAVLSQQMGESIGGTGVTGPCPWTPQSASSDGKQALSSSPGMSPQHLHDAAAQARARYHARRQNSRPGSVHPGDSEQH